MAPAAFFCGDARPTLLLFYFGSQQHHRTEEDTKRRFFEKARNTGVPDHTGGHDGGKSNSKIARLLPATAYIRHTKEGTSAYCCITTPAQKASLSIAPSVVGKRHELVRAGLCAHGRLHSFQGLRLRLCRRPSRRITLRSFNAEWNGGWRELRTGCYMRHQFERQKKKPGGGQKMGSWTIWGTRRYIAGHSSACTYEKKVKPTNAQG